MKVRARASGFTLVEVMVALGVVAMALPALMFSLHQQIEGTAYLRDKTLARMVASNKLTEIRIITQVRQELLKGQERGETELAQRQWHWRVERTETLLPNLYKVQIQVFAMGEDGSVDEEADEINALYTLSAFLAADFAQASQSSSAAGA